MRKTVKPLTKEEQTKKYGRLKGEKTSTFGKPKKSWTFGKKKYDWNKGGKKSKGFKNKKPKVKKNDIIDEEYSKWLGTQPCVVTGQVAERGAGAYNIHCHHIHGRGLGRNDYMQVPLMGFVHSWGDKSYHSNTKEDFIKHWKIMTDDIIEYFEDLAQYFQEKYKENGGIIQRLN